ncbi:hypothetical protein AB0I51_33770 [Streptomyces sp. NPDC050549]|uniref:hypothetical protein n=1 Tax=Streptomyces sp. NPDC050549 TaxID=3155406 RepID=UPI0034443EFD
MGSDRVWRQPRGGPGKNADRAKEAVKAHTRAIDLRQAYCEAKALDHVGSVLLEAADAEEAIEAYGIAAESRRGSGDWCEARQTPTHLARAHTIAGHAAEAHSTYLQASEAFTRANAPTEAADAQSRADSLT